MFYIFFKHPNGFLDDELEVKFIDRILLRKAVKNEWKMMAEPS